MVEDIIMTQKNIKNENDVIHRCLEPTQIAVDEIIANDYNPNRMPDREMTMLKDCILKYGFLFPILVAYEQKTKKYRIIDGFHRYESLKRIGETKITAIILDIPFEECMQLTILMNEIKGMHQVEGMADFIVRLKDQGVNEAEICKALNKPRDEINRLLMTKGIAPAFANVKYSKAWEVQENKKQKKKI